MSHDRPVAIVTGSTSGIGKAIAIRLLTGGYRVILNYATDENRAKQALEECKQIDADVVLVRADVGNPTTVDALFDQCASTYGQLDVLVNNAATVADQLAIDMTLDQWDRVLDVNLRGAFLCSQRAARIMLQQESGGSIINIGASTGIRGRRQGVNTCASKAGLMVLTQCLALELAPHLRVNTVIPGLTVTDETTERFHLDDPDVLRSRLANVPMGRLGLPNDIADAVLMLLSDQARFVTGQKLVVDGGQNMW